jgi:hypothetical protein
VTLTEARCARWEPFAPDSDVPCLSCGGVNRHAAWCGPDYLAQGRVTARPTTSSRIPAHVLDKPTIGAYRNRDLVAAKRWQPLRVDMPPTTAEEREWVQGRIIALAAKRQARSDAHRGRIRSTAAWLGREVSAHKVTLADADTRIDRLLGAFDPETDIPILLVPFREAKQIATDAFEATFKRHAHG